MTEIEILIKLKALKTQIDSPTGLLSGVNVSQTIASQRVLRDPLYAQLAHIKHIEGVEGLPLLVEKIKKLM